MTGPDRFDRGFGPAPDRSLRPRSVSFSASIGFSRPESQDSKIQTFLNTMGSLHRLLHVESWNSGIPKTPPTENETALIPRPDRD